VSVTTVEELKYYGIKTIIGLGFVGSFNQSLTTGVAIVADKGLIEMGTTSHYISIRDLSKDFVEPTINLCEHRFISDS